LLPLLLLPLLQALGIKLLNAATAGLRSDLNKRCC
jgi:hypothetical protein